METTPIFVKDGITYNVGDAVEGTYGTYGGKPQTIRGKIIYSEESGHYVREDDGTVTSLTATPFISLKHVDKTNRMHQIMQHVAEKNSCETWEKLMQASNEEEQIGYKKEAILQFADEECPLPTAEDLVNIVRMEDLRKDDSLPKYQVTVTRTYFKQKTYNIKAENQDAAEQQALEEFNDENDGIALKGGDDHFETHCDHTQRDKQLAYIRRMVRLYGKEGELYVYRYQNPCGDAVLEKHPGKEIADVREDGVITVDNGSDNFYGWYDLTDKDIDSLAYHINCTFE